jgi:hypothetical protein
MVVDASRATDDRGQEECIAEHLARETARLLRELDIVEARLNNFERLIQTPLSSSRDV